MKQVLVAFALLAFVFAVVEAKGSEEKQLSVAQLLKAVNEGDKDPINANCVCSTYACSCCVNNIPFINDLCVKLSWYD